MTKPLVAIVGRPNVGKSTFFNRMAGKRISIVEDIPGVTRDRIYADADWCGYNFTMVDTGGIEVKSTDQMWMHIKEQAELAIDLADVIVFMVDGKQGLIADDYEVANFLRQTKKPIILVVNKIDGNDTGMFYDFYKLGIGEPIPISASQGLNLGDMLDEIIKYFPKNEDEEKSEDVLKIAVVGKPNAGKSSLVNKILGFNRVIVSDIAGTTRDAIDTPFSIAGKDYKIIDTAGLRKKSKVADNVEYYSNVRSINSIRQADVVAVVIDATENMSEQDVRICGFVHESKKPSVIIMNKWDIIEKDSFTILEFNKKLNEALKFMSYFKPLYISALTGKRVNNVLDSLNEAYKNSSQKITTGALNDVLQDAISMNEPPTKLGRRLKIFYITQVGSNPPTFVLFVNDPALMHFSYMRYLENSLRKAFDFTGTPIRIITRDRNEN